MTLAQDSAGWRARCSVPWRTPTTLQVALAPLIVVPADGVLFLRGLREPRAG